MYCSQCGKEISDDSKFCSSCGSRTINIEMTDKSSSPSDTVHTQEITDVKGEINQDIKEEPISPPKTKWILDTPFLTSIFKVKTKPSQPNKKVKFLDTPVFPSIFKDETNSSQTKRKSKYGWGWFVLLGMYSKGLTEFEKSHVHKYPYQVELLSYFGIIVLYFWLRDYFSLYYFGYDNYKSSLISGIISFFLTSFLVGIVDVLFNSFT